MIPDRAVGPKLRDLDPDETHVAICDERILASGTSEQQVQEIPDDSMPVGKADHPYIYHFSP